MRIRVPVSSTSGTAWRRPIPGQILPSLNIRSIALMHNSRVPCSPCHRQLYRPYNQRSKLLWTNRQPIAYCLSLIPFACYRIQDHAGTCQGISASGSAPGGARGFTHAIGRRLRRRVIMGIDIPCESASVSRRYRPFFLRVARYLITARFSISGPRLSADAHAATLGCGALTGRGCYPAAGNGFSTWAEQTVPRALRPVGDHGSYGWSFRMLRPGARRPLSTLRGLLLDSAGSAPVLLPCMPGRVNLWGGPY